MTNEEIKATATILKKIRKDILEERDYAYADFEQYKVDYLGIDREYVCDELPNDDYRYGMERCIEIIDKVLSELKEEEKTGKWVYDWSISCECPKYICNVCGESVWLKTDRCPNCGAKMEEENAL